MLFVKIINLIEDMDHLNWFSRNDFFVKICYNNESRITTTKWNIDKPIWNESFVFSINESIKTLTIEIIENNKLKKEQLYKKYVINVNYNDIAPVDNGPIKITMGNIFYNLQKKIADSIYNFKNMESLIYERDTRLVFQAKSLTNKNNQMINLTNKLQSIKTLKTTTNGLT